MIVAPRHLALVFGVLLIAAVVDLVRRRRVREANALPWLLMGLGALLLGLWPALWRSLAGLLGGEGTPLLALVTLFLLVTGLQLSAEVTVLRRQVRKLARKVTLVEGRLEKKQPAGKSGQPD